MDGVVEGDVDGEVEVSLEGEVEVSVEGEVVGDDVCVSEGGGIIVTTS